MTPEQDEKLMASGFGAALEITERIVDDMTTETDKAIVAAARALVPFLIEGWDEYDDPEDQAKADAACNALIGAVRAAPPPAQEGMVSVPREPTEAMLLAMHNQIDWCRDKQNTHYIEHESQTSLTSLDGQEIGPSGTTCKQDLIDAYRAMLSAAPAPSQDADKEKK